MKMSRFAHTLAAVCLVTGISTTAFAAGITSCPGVSKTTLTKAQQSAQSQFCADVAACATGTPCSKKSLTKDGKTIFLNLVSQFNLPPFCAGAILAVMAQQVVDGKLSAGSCPAPR